MKIIILILTVSGLLFGAYTRDSKLQTVYDNQTNLTWQDEPYTTTEIATYSQLNGSEEGKVLIWMNAIDYCEELNFAGVQDWRLPNANELFMLADRTNGSSGISPVFQNITDGLYWSSTTYSNDISGGWYYRFDEFSIGRISKTGSYYVRCVRNGQLAPSQINTTPTIMYLLD